MKLSVKQMLGEFKEFAFKGNMIDLAVGVVIGAAFATVIKSVVENVIMPIISYIPGLHSGYENWRLGRIRIGHLLADLLNFSLIALAVFLVIVKLLGGVMRAAAHKAALNADAPAEPTTRECPRCLSPIPIKATKCPQCTADLPEVIAPAESDIASETPKLIQ